MPAAFFLRQHIGLGLELRVRRDRARLGDDLSALDLLSLDASQQQSDVVACHSCVQKLLEHLDARHDCVLRRLDTDDLDRLVDFDLSALDTAVATVPRPWIVKISSTGIRNGLSISRAGVGM